MEPNTVNLRDRMSINRHVLEWLQKQILSLEPGFNPGDRLKVDKIAAELGVSRTPVVNAINHLAAMNLVVIQTHSGFYVAAPEEEDLQELYQLIGQLEIASLRLAQGRDLTPLLKKMEQYQSEAERALQAGDGRAYLSYNRCFHNAMAAWSGNKKLFEIYQTVSYRTYTASLQLARDSAQMQIALAQHRGLIQALETGDQAAIETALQRHWNHETFDRYLKAKAQPD
jgi:DNA-binding GntR family transcriptional regulator